MNRLIGAFLVAFILLAFACPVAADGPDAVADLLARINRERVSRGLVPLALNGKLTQAAQDHANDMAASGKLSHTGSDGSTVFDRIGRRGYGAYHWGRKAGENWAWYHDTAAAMSMWMNSRPHRENILHPIYREVGIGVAPAPMGGFVYVLDLGAQPNVVPVFINDGSGMTNSPKVTVTLSNEDAATDGDGPGTMGLAREVMLSNDPNFYGANWQPFATRIPWTLAPTSGSATVYVKYRDAQGRTAISSDTISMGALSAANVAPSPTRTSSPTRSSTATPKPTRTVTRTSTRRPTVRPTASLTFTPLPTETPMVLATETPTATATATATDVPATLVPTGTAVPLAGSGDVKAELNAVAQVVHAESNLLAFGMLGVGMVFGVSAAVKWKISRRRDHTDHHPPSKDCTA